MKQIRTIVIDDSAFMRKMLTEILNSDPSIEVVTTARNGKDGIEKIKQYKPDVITLDIEMPLLDGLEALKIIMKEHPLPVVMVSSLTQLGAETTIQALNYGAVDFISKPSGPISLDIEKAKGEIIEKVKNAVKANFKMIVAPEPLPIELKIDVPLETNPIKKKRKIIGVGVSTGGPRALQKFLTVLPADFPAPILIVQHMPEKFTKSLADRLNKLSNITVKEAEHGEFLKNGTAYIAPGNYHLTVKKLGTSITAFIDQSDPLKGHRPSVDILFDSISGLVSYQKYAIVLTGMGTDGADGIKKLKKVDPKTQVLAEAEESSIVFGMPKAAIHTNFVDQIVNINGMGNALCKMIEK
ncbi:two-component system chemotaxis response regulator CheB [Salirhabdus euzebyi]|uniref:Protein-glutamate methylesterase/protein-glutamine glutaminase n=1 Tax=Salirhabdus euzebyi TaxID=394506 RepID=A0A841Q3D9_9BACI|nr:chemotaxis response regulator protein-glutamate methylesterase [Salirhabdus euzebyi]MBB6452904.1 two-component system chemotaxis response regulator CheB [Salirhabdus euzebyi]